MKFTVQNFGPIREAKNIEVKPMTVFVGPGNGGKSYMAMLIYAAIKSLFYDSEDYISWSMRGDAQSSNHVRKIVLACADSNEADACRAIGEYFKVFAATISEAWKEKAQHCFGEEGPHFLESASIKVAGSPPHNLEINLTDPQASKASKKTLGSIYRAIKNTIDEELQNPHLDVAGLNAPEQEDDNVFATDKEAFAQGLIMLKLDMGVAWRLSDMFLDALCGGAPQDTAKDFGGRPRSRRWGDLEAYYLPAIRGDIIHSYRIFLSALIRAGTKRSKLPSFNGVLEDFMEQLISIKPRSEAIAPFQEKREAIISVAEEIETKTLAGKIKVIPSHRNGPPDFQYSFQSNGSSKELSLMKASSSVSELAAVVLFIKNRLSPGDYFILEEPEAHLHPKAQREISIMLAKLVDAGVHVLITTHSDIVSEQVGNFIYAAKVSDKKVQNIPEENCAIYLFDKSDTGETKVKNVPFDLEDGYVTEDHMKVHSDLYNETASLISSVSRQVHDGD